MEPFSSLATIIGLVSIWKSEGRARSGDEYNDFIQWLNEKRHSKLIDNLESNYLLGLQIKQLLAKNHAELEKSLSNLDAMLLQLASQVDEFREIAKIIDPKQNVSDQALYILKCIIDSTSSSIQMKSINFLDVDWGASDNEEHEVSMGFVDGSGAIPIDEPKFLQDDLSTLVKLELLLISEVGTSLPTYTITRFAAKYIEQLEIEL
jgi:hypothetical protein